MIGLHRPTMQARAWADRGPLVLTVLVIGLTTFLASAVPQQMTSTADQAVKRAVTDAGPDAAIVVEAGFELTEGISGERPRPGRLVETLDDAVSQARSQLEPDLIRLVHPPLNTVTSSAIGLDGFGPGRVLQLGYVSGGDAKVTWTAGAAPRASVPEDELTTAIRERGQVWPFQVGLSQATADELKVAPGDILTASDSQRQPVEATVSGIFRPVDPKDPVWQLKPQLLNPVIGADGTGTRIELSALLSDASLPDGQLALAENAMLRTITFTPDPRQLRFDNVQAVTDAVVSLEATSGWVQGVEVSWNTGLDRVLQLARTRVLAAQAQALVLLIGLIATAVLVLLLAAELLVRRRALVLASVRMRGAALGGIFAELAVESVLTAGVGTGLGLGLAGLLSGDPVWAWVLPVLLVAVLAGPVLGTREAARATRGRQAPANRSARLAAVRTGQLRRAALELTVVLAATAAFVSLRQRGIVPADPEAAGSAAVLPAIAPTLGAATGALILLRLLPLVARFALARATRSPGSLPLFAAARAAANAARPLPFVVLIMSTALLTFALSVSSTESDGQAAGAWRSVGADARLDRLSATADLPRLAQQVAAAPGVDQALAASVVENVQVISGTEVNNSRLVIVDPAAFARLLAATGQIPAADGGLGKAGPLTLRWGNDLVKVSGVGAGPALGDGEGPVVVVDRTDFTAALATAVPSGATSSSTRLTADPDTIWAIGPGSAKALAAVATLGDQVLVQADVLRQRQDAPLTGGLLLLAHASIVVLLLWALLAVVLGAAAGAPGRGETLARLRTLGLLPREARRVATGELLPPVIIGALGGLLLGVLLARATLGQLALRLLTGQATDPPLVVPWSTGVPILVLIATVLTVVAVESSVRRRERLGQILRAGNM